MQNKSTNLLKNGKIAKRENLELVEGLENLVLTENLSKAIDLVNNKVCLRDIEGPFQYKNFEDDTIIFTGKRLFDDKEIVLEILSDAGEFNNPFTLNYYPDHTKINNIGEFDPTVERYKRFIHRVYERMINFPKNIFTSVLPIASNKDLVTPYFKKPLFFVDLNEPFTSLSEKVKEHNYKDFNRNTHVFLSYFEKKLQDFVGKKQAYFFNNGNVIEYKFKREGDSVAYPFTPLLLINEQFVNFYFDEISKKDQKKKIVQDLIKEQENIKYWVNKKSGNARNNALDYLSFEFKKDGFANIVNASKEQINEYNQLKGGQLSLF